MYWSVRFTVASLVAATVLVLTMLVPMEGLAQSTNDDVGNRAAARACEQNGWQDLQREEGTGFSNEDACVRYALLGGELQQRWGVMILEFYGSPSICEFAVTASGLQPNTTNLYTLWVIVGNFVYFSLPIPTDATGNARVDDIEVDSGNAIDVTIIFTRTEEWATNHEALMCR